MCKANGLVWELAVAVASGGAVPSTTEIEAIIWEQQHESSMLLELGSNAEALIERHIEHYAYARTGLNLLLYRLDDVGAGWPEADLIGFATTPSISAPAAVAAFSCARLKQPTGDR